MFLPGYSHQCVLWWYDDTFPELSSLVTLKDLAAQEQFCARTVVLAHVELLWSTGRVLCAPTCVCVYRKQHLQTNALEALSGFYYLATSFLNPRVLTCILEAHPSATQIRHKLPSSFLWTAKLEKRAKHIAKHPCRSTGRKATVCRVGE